MAFLSDTIFFSVSNIYLILSKNIGHTSFQYTRSLQYCMQHHNIIRTSRNLEWGSQTLYMNGNLEWGSQTPLNFGQSRKLFKYRASTTEYYNYSYKQQISGENSKIKGGVAGNARKHKHCYLVSHCSVVELHIKNKP